MVRRTYVGWSKDVALGHFLAMREFRSQAIRLWDAHFPMSPDYKAVQGIVEAIDAAAEHFGLDHHALYAGRDASGGARRYFRE